MHCTEKDPSALSQVLITKTQKDEATKKGSYASHRPAVATRRRHPPPLKIWRGERLWRGKPTQTRPQRIFPQITQITQRRFFDTGFALRNTRITRIGIGIAYKWLEEATSDRNKQAFFYPWSFSSALMRIIKASPHYCTGSL